MIGPSDRNSASRSGTFARTVAAFAEILDEQIRQNFRLGVHAMMLRVACNSMDQVDQDQQPRLGWPGTGLRAQRLDPVVDLPRDQVSRQRLGGKSVVQEIAGDRDA